MADNDNDPENNQRPDPEDDFEQEQNDTPDELHQSIRPSLPDDLITDSRNDTRERAASDPVLNKSISPAAPGSDIIPKETLSGATLAEHPSSADNIAKETLSNATMPDTPGNTPATAVKHTMDGATLPDTPSEPGMQASTMGGMTLADGTIIDADVEEQWNATLHEGYAADMTVKWRGAVEDEVRKSKLSSSVTIHTRGFDNNLPTKTELDVGRRHLTPGEVLEGPPCDYELLDILGEGGMGLVFNARQTCMNRKVAVKMVKEKSARKELVRKKFLSEAAATGNLDHPNIVAVHEFGQTEEGFLFYSMKQVRGNPWNKTIKNNDMEENLRILDSVCNAMAFAHDMGVIHRDLKPENVMLGDYNEVLVMDWGLAAAWRGEGYADPLADKVEVCGTPIYMPPEMAVGDGRKIGPCSDIYLLGAILYQILSGHAPHTGRNITHCLINAAQNIIRPAKFKGELMDIAMKAMATKPEERFATVTDLQKAIQNAISHSESVDLATRAKQDFENANKDKSYELYAQSIFRFREAINQWENNQEAHTGLSAARLAYGRAALANGDLDLAESVLVEDSGEFVALRNEIATARQEREKQERQRRFARRAMVGLVIAIIVIIVAAFFLVLDQYRKAVAAQKKADQKRIEADENAAKAAENAKRAKDALERVKKAQAKAEQELNARRADEARQGKLKQMRFVMTPEQARQVQNDSAAKHGWPVKRNISLPGNTKLELTLIPEGIFTMGSHPEREKAVRDQNEYLHDVRITSPFYIGTFEITQKQWLAIVGGKQPSFYRRNVTPRYPVENISFIQVQRKFMPALQKFAPKGFRFDLPSEAEWEYACRAGSVTAYCYGDDPAKLKEYAWYGANSKLRTHYTGGLKPNAWGLYDMHGNVAEFCKDSYEAEYYLRLSREAVAKAGSIDKAGPSVDPVNTIDSPLKVLRGGGCILMPRRCRSAYRSSIRMEKRLRIAGFRVVLRPVTVTVIKNNLKNPEKQEK